MRSWRGGRDNMATGVYKRVKPAWNKGKPMSAEQKAKIGESLKGRLVSQTTRDEIARSLKGRRHTQEALHNMVANNTNGFGPQARHWQGGQYLDGRGYVVCYAPQHPRAIRKTYVFEHILVAERTLGRYLMPNEVVHHINGIMNDNRPENLWVYDRSVHMKVHQRMMSQLVMELYRKGVVGFENGQYFVVEQQAQ